MLCSNLLSLTRAGSFLEELADKNLLKEQHALQNLKALGFPKKRASTYLLRSFYFKLTPVKNK